MITDSFRLNILLRPAVRWYVAPDPAHWDLSKLTAKWYWRPLAWCLRKLGGQYHNRTPECWRVQSYELKQQNVRELIGSSQLALQLLWERRATTLVIGYDEMEKLMNEAPTEMTVFNMPFDLHYSERGEFGMPPQIRSATRNLRVVLVPWLSGWALLPDLDK